jgi:hypothetical protein
MKIDKTFKNIDRGFLNSKNCIWLTYNSQEILYKPPDDFILEISLSRLENVYPNTPNDSPRSKIFFINNWFFNINFFSKKEEIHQIFLKKIPDGNI